VAVKDERSILRAVTALADKSPTRRRCAVAALDFTPVLTASVFSKALACFFQIQLGEFHYGCRTTGNFGRAAKRP
jgi:hypothetical protein